MRALGPPEGTITEPDATNEMGAANIGPLMSTRSQSAAVTVNDEPTELVTVTFDGDTLTRQAGFGDTTGATTATCSLPPQPTRNKAARAAKEFESLTVVGAGAIGACADTEVASAMQASLAPH